MGELSELPVVEGDLVGEVGAVRPGHPLGVRGGVGARVGDGAAGPPGPVALEPKDEAVVSSAREVDPPVPPHGEGGVDREVRVLPRNDLLDHDGRLLRVGERGEEEDHEKASGGSHSIILAGCGRAGSEKMVGLSLKAGAPPLEWPTC